MRIEEYAKESVGNWKEFDSFAWYDKYELEDPENWAIFYTHNRDSRLLDQCNADAIAKELEPFLEEDNPDIQVEDHNHWAVGWVAGYSIRVYDKDGKITPAFQKWFELHSALEDYPVLDEEAYSQAEYDATCENIAEVGRRLDDDYNLPEDWISEVFTWFWDNNQSAVENRDDQGGYPTEEELIEAFEGLGYEKIEENT